MPCIESSGKIKKITEKSSKKETIATHHWTSLVTQTVKNPPAMWEAWVRSLGWKIPCRRASHKEGRLYCGQPPVLTLMYIPVKCRLQFNWSRVGPGIMHVLQTLRSAAGPQTTFLNNKGIRVSVYGLFSKCVHQISHCST